MDRDLRDTDLYREIEDAYRRALEPGFGASTGATDVHAWSPDGSRILVIVAGPEAEQSDAVGSGTIGGDRDLPPWIPEVDSSDRVELARRRLVALDVATEVAEPASPDGLNVWEASWCGDDRIAAIVSDGPFEDDWYGARLSLIVPATRTARTLRESDVQLGGVSGSPDGSVIAVVEALCSDRLVVAGDLLLVDPSDGEARPVETRGSDVAATTWVDDGRLTVTAIRGREPSSSMSMRRRPSHGNGGPRPRRAARCSWHPRSPSRTGSRSRPNPGGIPPS